MLRSKCRYMDLGEKPSKFGTRNYTSKVISKLIDEDIEYTKTKDTSTKIDFMKNCMTM